MLRSRKLLSMPIISLEEGFQVGTVRNLVIDPEKMEAAALVMNQRGWLSEQKIVPYAQVRSTGSDAITIDKSASVQKIIKLPELVKLVRLKADPIGAKVVTETGTMIGFVDEYCIEESTGKIVSLEISGKFLENLFTGRALLPSEQIKTIGADIIIVKEGAEQKLEKIDGSLQGTFNSIKQNTCSLWASTKERTMQLSKNLKEKYEKKEPVQAPEAAETAVEVTITKEEILSDVSTDELAEPKEEKE